MKKRGTVIILFVFLAFGLANGLARGYEDYKSATPAGFWEGVVQGILSPATASLHVFNQNVEFYNPHNDGFWYNLGFFVPAILFCEITLPLLAIAWVVKIFWILVLTARTAFH